MRLSLLLNARVRRLPDLSLNRPEELECPGCTQSMDEGSFEIYD